MLKKPGIAAVLLAILVGTGHAQTNVTFVSLFSFDATSGVRPDFGLTIGADRNLYGTTFQAGAYGHGTIFKITPSGRLTVLFSFNGTNGCLPAGELVQGPDGALYGSTSHGGHGYDPVRQAGAGTVFRINTDGQGFTNLHFFEGMGEPVGELVCAPDNNFYGLTKWDGAGHEGSIFRISPEGKFETLLSLNDKTGAIPTSGMILGKDGNMYGTMAWGGQYYTGDFFRLATNGLFTVLASFEETNNVRVSRNKLTQGANGDFYGTTVYGGPYNNEPENDGDGDGTVFKVGTNGAITTIAVFNGTNGAHPKGALVQSRDGSLYGVSAGDNSTIFRVTTNGIIETLYSFWLPFRGYWVTNGWRPCGVVEDDTGAFYGTTALGGAMAHSAGFGGGTIFRFTVK